MICIISVRFCVDISFVAQRISQFPESLPRMRQRRLFFMEKFTSDEYIITKIIILC